jgi:Kef-type K+ transport system membrane component KefB
MEAHEPSSFLIIVAIAAAAPFVCEWPRTVRLPLVVLEIVLGILVGPHVLGWAESGPTIQVFSNFGMAFLFFMAGFEINFQAIRGRPISLTGAGWLVSLGLGLGIGFALQGCGIVESGLIVGAALTTTALGTLMPILRDARELPTRFGAYAVAAGAIGEFGPILVIATLLAGAEGGHGGSLALMAAFAAITLVGAWVALTFRPPRIILVLQEKMHTSAQLPVRVAILALASLVFLARQFGLDSIMGAMAAGVVVALTAPGEHGDELRHKLDSSATALWQLPMFLIFFLIVRGLPALFVWTDLDAASRLALALLSATQLPLVVAIAEIGQRSGRLQSETAAALVGAGMVSVLLFPAAALALRRSRMQAAERSVEGVQVHA